VHNGNVALVTGGGSGIGRAVALRFAAEGYLVAICGRTPDCLEATRSAAQKCPGWVEPFSLDITDCLAVAEMVEAITRKFSKINVLVNCAGQAFAKPALDTSQEEWKNIFDVNLHGTVNCSKAVLPFMMEEREGVIINISSTLGKKAIGSMAAYCASKFAVIGFTQSLAAEMEAFSVGVYAVCPGATDTPLHRSLVGDELAQQAMLPGKVADLVYSIATGSINITSGTDIVIDLAQAVPRLGCIRRLVQLIRKYGLMST